ncbi:helix-turn-helix transcriptional regulator [Sodalis endosymbiont of Spalangia cameroni]|uniref:helix-turn-helix domain-containing protein n=1 Tax=Sodalis praecaptivus TaxID=1239307 RepID=UPI0031F9F300
MTNKSSLGEKIRKIREAEGISRQRLSEMLDVPYSSLNNYETKNIQVTENIMIKITNHPTFQKYTLWLMNGLTAPEAGQIEPALSHDGFDGLKVDEPTEKTVSGSDVRSSRSVRKTG